MDVHFSSEDSLPSGLFFFLSWNSPSGVEQFCILSESFLSDFDRCVSCLVCCCNVFLFFVLIDVVKHAFQPNFQLVEDGRLRALVQDLPAVLLKSKSTNTTKKYERGFNAWKKWASQFKEIVIFPASSVYVSLFFLTLIQESHSCSIIGEVHYGFIMGA